MSIRSGSILQRLDQGIARVEATVLGLSMLIMAGNTIANVIGRYVIGRSIYFADELNEILMVTVTFVGLGYVTRKGRHIRMTALYDALPEGIRRWLMVVIAITTAAVMFLLAWHAWDYVAKMALRGRITPSLQIPLWTTYVGVVIGLVLTGIQYLLAAWANITRPADVWISHEETDAYEDPELSTLLEHERAAGTAAGGTR